MPSDDERRAASDPAPEGGQGADERVFGAGGVVFDRQGRVLVLLHQDGDWVFPKGHVEPGETPLEAALREVNEESGVTATCLEPDRNWTTTYRNSRGELREITWFACLADDDVVTLTEELFLEGVFLPAAAALDRLTHAADRQLLAQLLDDTGEGGAITERSEDGGDR